MWFVVFPLLLLIFVLCVWSSFIWLICNLGCFALDFPVCGSLGFLDLGGYFLPHFREVFNYYLLKYFLMAFPFVSSSGTPMIWMLGRLTLFQRSLRLSSFLLILFLFFFPLLHLFPPFYLPPHLSYLLPLLLYCWFPPEYFWSQFLYYVPESSSSNQGFNLKRRTVLADNDVASDS